jgi:hypothetical protein
MVKQRKDLTKPKLAPVEGNGSKVMFFGDAESTIPHYTKTLDFGEINDPSLRQEKVHNLLHYLALHPGRSIHSFHFLPLSKKQCYRNAQKLIDLEIISGTKNHCAGKNSKCYSLTPDFRKKLNDRLETYSQLDGTEPKNLYLINKHPCPEEGSLANQVVEGIRLHNLVNGVKTYKISDRIIGFEATYSNKTSYIEGGRMYSHLQYTPKSVRALIYEGTRQTMWDFRNMFGSIIANEGVSFATDDEIKAIQTLQESLAAESSLVKKISKIMINGAMFEIEIPANVSVSHLIKSLRYNFLSISKNLKKLLGQGYSLGTLSEAYNRSVALSESYRAAMESVTNKMYPIDNYESKKEQILAKRCFLERKERQLIDLYSDFIVLRLHDGFVARSMGAEEKLTFCNIKQQHPGYNLVEKKF